MNRRGFLRAAGAGAAVGAAMINRGRYLLFGAGREYSARAVELVQRSTVIDMLAPLWISPSKTQKMLGNPENFKAEDFAPYKDSGINVFHISIGTGGPDAYLETLQFLSGYNSFLARHDAWFERVDTPARLDAIKASGKVGLILGIQNSEHFRKADDVDYFYGLGQRVSQLTYNARTLIGNGSTERRDEGLSDFGVSIVERMNKLGMAVDVSHCGDKTTLDAFEVSKKPVLITHSNCRALNPNHPRCKTDEAIKAMAAKGGVMGITMERLFVGSGSSVTMENVLDHVDHAVKTAGIEHVGIGTDVDLDGRDRGAARKKNDLDGVEYTRKIYNLTEGLIRRRYSKPDIRLILGGNFQRALTAIWEA